MIERRTAASTLSMSWITGLRSELFSSSFWRRRMASLYSVIWATIPLLVSEATIGIRSPRVRRVVEVVADVVGDADLVFDRKPFDLEFAAL